MNEIRKLNISDLMIRILKQWKKIIMFVLVFGLLMGAVATVSFLKARNNNSVPETDAETKKISYSAHDQKIYDRQEEALERNKEFYNMYKDYLENSIKMQVNPDHVFEGKVECLLSGIDQKEVLRVKNACEEIVKQTDFCDKVREKLNTDIEDDYIREIVSLSFNMYEEASGLLEFTVIHFDEDSCQSIIDILKTELQNIQLENSLCEIMGASVVETNKFALATEQDTYYGLKWNYYDKLKQVEADRENLKMSYQTAPIEINTQNSQFNILYVVFGLIGGGILGIIYFGIKYLFSDRIHAKEDIGGLQEVPVVTITDENKAFKCFVDRWINKLEKKTGNIPTTSAEMALLPVIMSAIKKNITGVCLTGTLFSAEHTGGNIEMIQKVKDLFAKYNLEVIMLNSILGDADSMKKSADIANVILYEVCEKSSHKKLCEEVSKLQQCGIEIQAIILEK